MKFDEWVNLEHLLGTQNFKLANPSAFNGDVDYGVNDQLSQNL